MKQTFTFTRYIVVMVMVGLMLGSGLPVVTAAKNAPVQMVPQNFSSLADTVSPAVVHIRVEKTVKGGGPALPQFKQNPFGDNEQFKEFFGRNFGQQRQPEFKQPGQGSGFIIDKSGYIVTNNHVVAGADTIKVILKDDTEYDAKIVGRDPVTDIALIKVAAKGNLPTVPMGSSEKLRVGEWVAAIGSPFGLEHTVTAGIVSAKGRVIGSGPYDDFIQTDASINPGNSGGPLINMRGEIVGINTMIIAGGSGIGFAIPIDLAKGIVVQLKTSGEVTRGWLGVTIQDLKGDLAEYYGVQNKSGVLVVVVFCEKRACSEQEAAIPEPGFHSELVVHAVFVIEFPIVEGYSAETDIKASGFEATGRGRIEHGGVVDKPLGRYGPGKFVRVSIQITAHTCR